MLNDPLYHQARRMYNECAVGAAVLDLMLRDWPSEDAPVSELAAILTDLRDAAAAALAHVTTLTPKGVSFSGNGCQCNR